ncbi:MAG: glycosyltransferase family 2 protein [Arcanobacterium sp.]|nr:glycosyltransferase family 2 protein [Arcanobacterium sp.]
MVDLPLISVGVIALNEEQTLPAILGDIATQDYPHRKIQIVLVDSGSTDTTPLLMCSFAENYPDFAGVEVLDNPKKIQPAGWNVVFTAARGSVVVRLDAHARIPADFISNVVQVLSEGENVVGGLRPTTVPEGAAPWQHTLLAAEDSLFGASIAHYRGGDSDVAAEHDGKDEVPKYVKSVFHPAYRREVIDEVGLFDERLVRTEDNDYSYRVRQAGYKIRFDHRIRSQQLIRPTLRLMAKQKYANGYWVGRTLFIQPCCIEVYHLVPAAFVTALVGAGMLALGGKKLPAKLLGGAYGVAAGAMAVAGAATASHRHWSLIALPVIFPILHIAYGIGTWKGIMGGLFKKL